MKEIQFDLTEPLKYSGGEANQFEEANYLILQAPTAALIKHTAKIKSIFMEHSSKSSQSDSVKSITKEDMENFRKSGVKITAEMIEMVLFSTPNIDGMLSAFSSLFHSGVVKMPDGQSLTPYLSSKMLSDDYERMIGVYAENFIIGSLMSRLKQL